MGRDGERPTPRVRPAWQSLPLLVLLVFMLGGGAWVLVRKGPAPGSYSAPAPTVAPLPNRPDPSLRLQAVTDAGAPRCVRLEWAITGTDSRPLRATFYRSTSDLSAVRALDPVTMPVSTDTLPDAPAQGSWTDRTVPDGVKCHWQIRLTDGGSRTWFSNVVTASTPPVSLQAPARPVVRIDKGHYVLTVGQDGGTDDIKRFPVALGRNPVRRKLHQDNSSTPEGVYQVASLQPAATYHRAYDLDYPSPLDQLRYDFAQGRGLLPRDGGLVPGIGGEIQVHGKGITRNWTYGCIALRNEDMDELFSQPTIAVGVPVLVFGGELEREDCEALRQGSPNLVRAAQESLKTLGLYQGTTDGLLGPATITGLGEFQRQAGLTVSCLPDRATREALEKKKTR